jgi:hypothetical protein
MQFERYKIIRTTPRANCVVCDNNELKDILHWSNFPITELYVDKPVPEGYGTTDLQLQYCPQCSHTQLKHVVPPELQYGDKKTYNFRTSQSLTGRETTIFFTDFMFEILGKKHISKVIEVGCNDLHLLDSISDYADQLIGIDPILKGYESQLSTKKIKVIGDLFENTNLESNFDVVICKDIIEHVASPYEFMAKLIAKVDENATVFVQVPAMEAIVEDNRFDQVFHQHLNYFSVASFNRLLERLGCDLIDYRINPNHWGAAIFAFKKKPHTYKLRPSLDLDSILYSYQIFRKQMTVTTESIIKIANKSEVYGYGAALMLAALDYHLAGKLALLSGIIDDDPKKTDKYYMQLPVRIHPQSEIKDISKVCICITAISSRINVKRILKKLLELNPSKIINPVNVI